MKKIHIIFAVLLAVTLIASSVLGGCASDNQDRLKVVTSISLISSIVERIGGDSVDVINIIPPAQCPGHFDISPGDIQKLAEADLFLLAGWQGEMFSQELIDSANNPDLTVVTLDTPSNPQSNWMIPAVQQEVVGKITAALSQSAPQISTDYNDSPYEYTYKIESNYP